MAYEGFPVTVGVDPSFYLCYNILMKKKPNYEGPWGKCPKCGKIYTSWVTSKGHGAGACNKIPDARDLYTFPKK